MIKLSFLTGETDPSIRPMAPKKQSVGAYFWQYGTNFECRM